MRRQQDGFTLIELLLVIVILGIIAVPLGNVIIGFLRNNAATTGRLSESHDAQISSAYFQQDVSSIGVRDYTAVITPPASYPLKKSVETGVASTGGLYPCGAATLPNAVVRLAWDDFTSAPTSTTPVQNRAAYVVETASGQTQLHRVFCSGSTTVISDSIIAHDLVSATVACSTACTGSDADTGVPKTVTLTLTIHDPASGSAANYSVALTGNRRQS
jgi:prepilin-type N-terminal cleavage/methylation domain-containing protein